MAQIPLFYLMALAGACTVFESTESFILLHGVCKSPHGIWVQKFLYPSWWHYLEPERCLSAQNPLSFSSCCVGAKRLALRGEKAKLRESDPFNTLSCFLQILKSFIDDGMEGSTINTWSESTARESCRSQCGASDVYHGIRKSSEDQFTCRCFDRTFTSLLGKVSWNLGVKAKFSNWDNLSG